MANEVDPQAFAAGTSCHKTQFSPAAHKLPILAQLADLVQYLGDVFVGKIELGQDGEQFFRTIEVFHGHRQLSGQI
jgi:hypothetical protein